MMTPESAYYAAALESIHAKLDRLREGMQQTLLAQAAALAGIALLAQNDDEAKTYLHTIALRTRAIADSLEDK